jgi:cytochrome c oxidase subunit II
MGGPQERQIDAMTESSRQALGRLVAGAAALGPALAAGSSAARAAADTTAEAAVRSATKAALADAPMLYLRSFGSRGHEIADLIVALLVLSVAVVLIIAVAVLIGSLHNRARGGPDAEGRRPVERGGKGVLWIYVGLPLTVVALIGSVTWTMVTMAAIADPPRAPAATIEITGHQWWWEIRYESDDPSREFITANEIHVPVGEPVRFELRSADVIHTFWVPALSGKTDLIPGQTNTTWLEADEPGVYRGQCNEYCGQQHAHMALSLYADPPDQFQAWWHSQLQSATAPAGTAAATGQQQFQLKCGACHSVRGSLAGGRVGPDLTHLMSRSTIAAGMLPNTIGNLSGWIANPQVLKPGCKMPNLELSGPDLQAIRSYLLTLK